MLSVMQVVKHVLGVDQANLQAVRLMLRCLEFLRSLRLDAILSGAAKKPQAASQAASRPEDGAGSQPSNWDKVPRAACAASSAVDGDPRAAVDRWLCRVLS